MEGNKMNSNVVVIGAGVSGIQVSTLLAEAGRKVYLVERAPLIGGNAIKYEEVFPNMECATCMLAPKQQDLLQEPNIDLMLLSRVKELRGSPGDYTVVIEKSARYVDLDNCIGCGECYAPCPVTVENEFEERLSERKAIYVACSGALPNVPAIDPEHCLRLTGQDGECQACQEACLFEAIDFSQEDETIEVQAGAIVVATGFSVLDASEIPRYGYGRFPQVYTAMEFERLNAANGPTEGGIRLRDGSEPRSIAVIHCVGRHEKGYCSGICCMYSVKFSRYLKHKFPNAQIWNFYADLCIPGKSFQGFYERTRDEGVQFVWTKEVEAGEGDGGVQVKYSNGNGDSAVQAVDMIILSPAMIGPSGAEDLAHILGVEQDAEGFFLTQTDRLSSVSTAKEGIYVAGCAAGPRDIADCIAQAEAVAANVLSTS
jgi:heterodisulfide reductase subunit A